MNIPEKILWGCINDANIVHHCTLSPTRKASIERLIEIFNSPMFAWKNLKRMGWRCIKLKVSFYENNSRI